jgi:hypothetical protein
LKARQKASSTDSTTAAAPVVPTACRSSLRRRRANGFRPAAQHSLHRSCYRRRTAFSMTPLEAKVASPAKPTGSRDSKGREDDLALDDLSGRSAGVRPARADFALVTQAKGERAQMSVVEKRRARMSSRRSQSVDLAHSTIEFPACPTGTHRFATPATRDHHTVPITHEQGAPQ